MKSALPLVNILVDPAMAVGLDGDGWTQLIAIARAEQMIGTLACRLEGVALPMAVADLMADERRSIAQARIAALWEAEMARRTLDIIGCPMILLKGTAFAAAEVSAAAGRSIGDLDILVPRDALDAVEHALCSAGWEWVKDDPYDQQYYRRWMHELPPLIQRDRDRMIDVHHTILPLTARLRPDAAALIEGHIMLPNGFAVLSPEDMIVHAATHMLADGDLSGGLRNLWDVDRLLRDFASQPNFWERLIDRAMRHQMLPVVRRMMRLAQAVYGTPIDAAYAQPLTLIDKLYVRRLLARDGWGRGTNPALRGLFYVRSHWIRMPPLMLARHLAIKAHLLKR